MSSDVMLASVERILRPFIDEALPEGGIDASRSLWQKPGRGSASGSDMFPGKVDVRYLRFLVEDLYRIGEMTGNTRYRSVANSHVRYVAKMIREDHPTWAWGNALEMIGLYHAYNPRDDGLVECARRVLAWAKKRSVKITTREGVTFLHYPCGYGFPYSKDAGWTNDLSMFGSGIVWAHELTGDESYLEDAVSFAEYFVQPWRSDGLGDDGYWHCGTWRDDTGSWVIGPAHYTGFESTDVYADQSSWVISMVTCVDFLTRLHRVHPDARYLDRCLRAAKWTFSNCQFEDGAVGLCGRDDKWLGLTGDSITQVAMLRLFAGETELYSELLEGAKRAFSYLAKELPSAKISDHGVKWVTHKTSTDPLVNVGMLWVSAVLGYLSALDLGL